MGDTDDDPRRREGGGAMNIGEQVRTVYIEPIEEPPPTEEPARLEPVPDLLPDTRRELEPTHDS
jgi:hypothetical protein